VKWFRGKTMGQNTLIVFETLYGSTKQVAIRISKILTEDFNHDVTVHNIGKDQECPNLENYDNIIVGSCIYNGSWGGHADTFLKNNFEGKNVALFVCSMFAGEQSLYRQAYSAYLETKLEMHRHFIPISMEAFGGRVPLREYPEQWIMHVANKLPEFTTDNRSIDRAEIWAKELGTMLEKMLAEETHTI
jgi:menaquinone-dependent protoporphyrinogen IX oxidase